MGRNIALPNSFSLDMTNNSSSTFTFNLFNQGGALQTQVSNNQTLYYRNDNDLVGAGFMNLSGNVLASTTFELYDGYPTGTLLKTTTLSAGQNISLLNTALSPVVGTNGQTGYFSITQQASPLNKFVNFAVGSANVLQLKIIAGITLSIATLSQTSSFVTTNPLVTLGGTIPFNEILNSETGNAYKIDGMDIISNNSQQLTEDVEYGFKDANGDKVRLSSTNYVDVYQPQSTSLQNILTPGFVIDSETLFTYNVLGYTFVRITFNYVRAQLSIMKQFDQAIAQEFVYESNKLYSQLQVTDSKRYILYQ